MRTRSSLKQEFFRKWIKGLQKCSSLQKNMSFLDRKNAIKLSADLAMASIRDENRRWSRALVVSATVDEGNKVLRGHILGSSQYSKKLRNNSTNSSPPCSRRIRCRKTMRRSHRVRRVKNRMMANSSAKSLVQKETKRLKSLLPGGEFMDNVSLIDETLDYIESLRAQVEVMRCLVTASEELIISSP